MIRDVELPAGLLYNFIDLRVVDMTDPGKQVMLYLKIQSAQEPEKKFALRGEVGSCADLMKCPFPFHFFTGRKFGDLHHVGQLKNDADK